MKRFAGFTLIEVLITITILLLVSGGALASFTNFNNSQILKTTAEDLKNNLRFTQTKTISGDRPVGCTNPGGYQVTFLSGSPDSYTIYALCNEGNVLASGPFNLPQQLKFNPLPSSITFKTLGQGVIGAGNIDICGHNLLYRVSISATGEIENQGKVGAC